MDFRSVRFWGGVLLVLVLCPVGALAGDAVDAQAVEASLARFEATVREHGVIDPARNLVVRRSRTDNKGITHVRFDQFYKGVRVFEGEAISHVAPSGKVLGVTSALRGRIDLDVTPKVTVEQAIQTAVERSRLRGSYVVENQALEVLPRGERSSIDRLTWHVTVLVENATDETARWEYFVDAHTGDVAWSYNSLATRDKPGTAKSMFSGDQAIRVDFKITTGKYFLRDLTRGGGNYACDMQNSFRRCSVFSSTTNVFGNNDLNNTDRATAGADAYFGMQETWDYFKVVHGRNGIDNTGKKAYSRVHYSINYENAYWSDSCFCMTYGDGASTFYPLVSLDIAGHEMAHGVMSSEANLTYSGESGGLNESSSDVFGTMVEYYAAGAGNPDTADYWIGERVYRANWSNNGTTYNQTKALRYMDDPHKDGISPACWSSSIGSLDVHYSSGPNNHMFYLLAEGGTSKCNGNVVTGIGRDTAQRIWYKAIADFMTASTNYAGARQACLDAAVALGFGPSSTEYKAVNNAYAAINVGTPIP